MKWKPLTSLQIYETDAETTKALIKLMSILKCTVIFFLIAALIK